MSQILVLKSTGEQETFVPAKLILSLHKAGATDAEANRICEHIEKELVNGIPTSEIYKHAFEILRQDAKPVAARYSMKRAIADLGPSGFPFEKLIAEIFKAKGYEAVTGQIIQGKCVEHEVDVVAWKGDKLSIVEAKFHNEPGLKSDLKVALYIRARFDDLKNGSHEYGGKMRKISTFQLFTNTKFTDHAIRYAECQGLSLIGWNYPDKGNLEDLINESKLHPLTSLLSLSPVEKRSLLDAGLILCKHIAEREADLPAFGIEKAKIPMLLDEIANVCK